MTYIKSMKYEFFLKQLSKSTLFKLFTVATNYMLVSYIIKNIGFEHYGIYTATISVSTWMFLFDFGLAKGMRNIVTTSLAKGNINEVKNAISVTYIAVFILVFIFSMVFSILFFKTNIFSSAGEIKDYDESVYLIVITCFVFFFLSIIDQLHHAVHKSDRVFLNALLVSLTNISLLYLYAQNVGDLNFKICIIVFCIAKVMPYIMTTIILFFEDVRFRPVTSNLDFSILPEILKKSVSIISIQFCLLLIIGLDRVILLNFSLSNDISTYDIVYKVMALVMVPFSLLISPLWASISKALALKDFKMIGGVIANFNNFIWIVILILSVIIYFFDYIVFIWIGIDIQFDFVLLFFMAVLFLEFIYCGFFTDLFFAMEIYKVTIVVLFVSLALKYLYLYLCFNYDCINVLNVTLSSVLGYFTYAVFFIFKSKKLIMDRFV